MILTTCAACAAHWPTTRRDVLDADQIFTVFGSASWGGPVEPLSPAITHPLVWTRCCDSTCQHTTGAAATSKCAEKYTRGAAAASNAYADKKYKEAVAEVSVKIVHNFAGRGTGRFESPQTTSRPVPAAASPRVACTPLRAVARSDGRGPSPRRPPSGERGRPTPPGQSSEDGRGMRLGRHLLRRRVAFAMAASGARRRLAARRALGRVGDRVRGEVERITKAEPRKPGFSRSAISTFCCVSSPKVPFAARPARGSATRRDAVGDPFRVDAVTDRFVDAVPSREPVPGRDGRDVRVATVFCVSGGGRGSSGRAKSRRMVNGSDSGPAAALTPGQS